MSPRNEFQRFYVVKADGLIQKNWLEKEEQKVWWGQTGVSVYQMAGSVGSACVRGVMGREGLGAR